MDGLLSSLRRRVMVQRPFDASAVTDQVSSHR
jgi:hypothetical protein